MMVSAALRLAESSLSSRIYDLKMLVHADGNISCMYLYGSATSLSSCWSNFWCGDCFHILDGACILLCELYCRVLTLRIHTRTFTNFLVIFSLIRATNVLGLTGGWGYRLLNGVVMAVVCLKMIRKMIGQGRCLKCKNASFKGSFFFLMAPWSFAAGNAGMWVGWVHCQSTGCTDGKWCWWW
jgi:hypothetical protein